MKIQPTVTSVKARNDFSIFSSVSNVVQSSGTCWWQLGLVLIIPVKFHPNPISGLTEEDRQDFSIFSSGGHVVQSSRTCGKYAQLGLVLIIPVELNQNL